MDDLRVRVRTIEATVQRGTYRAGAFADLVRLVRTRTRRERVALAADLTRLSATLHRRHLYRTWPVGRLVMAEAAATVAGGLLVAVGRRRGSPALATLALPIWVTTLQPLVKAAIGRALGVRYDYAYLAGIEPRLKMAYGSYLAAPRAVRVVLHLAGCAGSPLGAWLAGRLAYPTARHGRDVAYAVAGTTAAINVALLAAALAGVRRIAGVRLEGSSGGAAGAELREALAQRAAQQHRATGRS